MRRAAFAALLLALSSVAATAAGDSAGVLGTWRGESLCTVKPSACHDEVVVYHVARGKSADTVVVTANKIVGGEEQTMGMLDCTWDGTRATLTCPFPKGAFRYTIEGRTMRGTLTLTDGTLFRRISARKSD